MANDLISRRVAILQLSHNKCGNDENDIAVQHDIETIIALPSAQPEQRWIPVTERLPEEDTKVIVSCTDGSGDSEFSFTTTGWHYKGMWLVDNERSCFVRAWMPLPKSYSERRQDG